MHKSNKVQRDMQSNSYPEREYSLDEIREGEDNDQQNIDESEKSDSISRNEDEYDQEDMVQQFSIDKIQSIDVSLQQMSKKPRTSNNFRVSGNHTFDLNSAKPTPQHISDEHVEISDEDHDAV